MTSTFLVNDHASNDGDDQQDRAIADLTGFFEVSRDLLCIRDMGGRFARLSRSWEDALGYPLAQLEGTPLLPLIHPDDHERTLAHMRRVEAAQPGEAVRGFINRYRRSDGEYRQLEWRAQRQGDRVYGVARDVTERIAAEAEMAAAKIAAEAASQAKSDFLANMSHEIRTPLNGVIGIIDALARTELTPRQREMVDLVQGSGVTLERLVSDILDVSKIEAGQLEIEARPFDLEGELNGVIDSARMRAEDRGLAFEDRRGPTARGGFLGDSTRVKQVLANLLSNAVKFTSHGVVAVSVDVADDPDGEGPSRLILEVRDTGVGFDSEKAANLFQRFTQADTTITRRFGGTGLGLSICQSLIGMMDGEMFVESAPGQGSRFRVELPLDRTVVPESVPSGPARREAPGTDARAPVSDRPLRVLLADDHPVNQRVVQLILGEQGAEIVTVDDGLQAVAAFEGGVFDLVLMDMQMPHMDGLAATRALRAFEAADPARGRTPVVMLSANAMAQHCDDALAAGADLHVPKPITAASLLAGLAAVLQPAEAAAGPR